MLCVCGCFCFLVFFFKVNSSVLFPLNKSTVLLPFCECHSDCWLCVFLKRESWWPWQIFAKLVKTSFILFTEVQIPLTNGAVVPFPSGAALTLPIFALPVLSAVGMAGALLTGGSHPALLTLADSSWTHTVAAAVQGTQLCTGIQKHITWKSNFIPQVDFALMLNAITSILTAIKHGILSPSTDLTQRGCILL